MQGHKELLHVVRHQLSVKDKQNIAIYRHGSLVDFSAVHDRITEIAKKMHLCYKTVANFLYRLRDEGPDALTKRRLGGSQRTIIGTRDVERLLLSDCYLKRWAHLPMWERAIMVRQVFNVTVSKRVLVDFYRRHNIRFKKTFFKFRGEETHSARLEQERTNFATCLAYLQRHRIPFAFFDETTFTSWQRKERMWYYRGVKPKVPMS